MTADASAPAADVVSEQELAALALVADPERQAGISPSAPDPEVVLRQSGTQGARAPASSRSCEPATGPHGVGLATDTDRPHGGASHLRMGPS
jgi:hypothetical protein